MSSPSEYETLILHAWKAGSQTQLLRDQLLAMPAGQDVIMTIPKAPCRCPPGPYERACVIADWLKRNKPGSRIIVLDANAGIIVEKDNFNHAFTVTHAGLLNDPQNRPFAPVHVLSYQSKADPLTHVIGDASLTTQPKAGHIGNQQAKTCADAALRLLSKRPPNTPVVTNSACYTPITSTTATWLAAVYQYDSVTQTMVMPAQHNNDGAIAATAATTDNYEDMQTWFKTLMGDTFS